MIKEITLNSLYETLQEVGREQLYSLLSHHPARVKKIPETHPDGVLIDGSKLPANNRWFTPSDSPLKYVLVIATDDNIRMERVKENEARIAWGLPVIKKDTPTVKVVPEIVE